MMRSVACLSAVFLTDAARVVRSKDDLEQHVGDDSSKAGCVDCKEYFEMAAQDKLDRLWANILSDEYKTPFTTSCLEHTTCHCDGDVDFGLDAPIVGGWTPKKVPSIGSFSCNMDFFPGQKDPAPGLLKRCRCHQEFPKQWIGLLKRNLQDQKGRVDNGTMPMFFDRFSDENPENAAKVIHTHGSVAKVKFVPQEGTGYTGMFEKGADHAILRLSIVADWEQPCKGGTDFKFDGCLKPSMALKMLRDNDYSSNTVAQINLGDGVGFNFDFGRFIHSTFLPTPSGLGAELIKKLFGAAADEIAGVGLQEISSDGSKAGQKPSDIKDPKVLFFVPGPGLTGKFSNEEHDPRNDFKKIPAGSRLFDVFTVDFADTKCSPDGQPQLWDDLSSSCPKTLLGHVETKSRFVASAYEDHRLFFQHERLRTKGGPWHRKQCMADAQLGVNAEFRMAGDQRMTCTNSCPSSTSSVSNGGECPFGMLE